MLLGGGLRSPSALLVLTVVRLEMRSDVACGLNLCTISVIFSIIYASTIKLQ